MKVDNLEFTEEQSLRYARHFVLSEIGMAGQKKLLSSKVLVIGCGAIGGAALMYLAAAGVGTLGICDYDYVDISNLQRQIIHRSHSVGASKLFSAEKAIREINTDVKIIVHDEKMTADNILPAISNYDFILDCTDRFESKFLINDSCAISKKPYSHAGVVRFGGQIMTYVPGMGPCLRCILDEVPSIEDSPTCASIGVLGSVTGIIGSIQATEAIKYLTEIGRLLTGRILRIDALNMDFHVINMPDSSHECRVCGKQPNIITLADNRFEYEI